MNYLFFILMDYPIHSDEICMELTVLYFKGESNFYKMIYFWSLKIVFILANSTDPKEIEHYAKFHLCLHCLLKLPE